MTTDNNYLITRRSFLKSSLALGGLALLPNAGVHAALQASESDFLAFIADIHIFADKNWVNPYSDFPVCPFDRLLQLREQILSDHNNPSRVILAGDCACDQGTIDDYVTMFEGFDPFRLAGIPVHFAVGNHDNRNNLVKAMADFQKVAPPDVFPERLQSIIELPLANIFILDTLVQSYVVQMCGFLGRKQLDWLAYELDLRPDKPAILVAHHPPMPKEKNPGDLIDTEDLFDVIRQRKHVKAYIFGHSHRWQIYESDGIHLVNLPTSAWSGAGLPYGWVLAELKKNGLYLTLQSLDSKHPKHGEFIKLAWRNG
jgi:3',5'-cyclic AMP phosphodiesterase CpdA